jgi:hypothetical protein
MAIRRRGRAMAIRRRGRAMAIRRRSRAMAIRRRGQAMAIRRRGRAMAIRRRGRAMANRRRSRAMAIRRPAEEWRSGYGRRGGAAANKPAAWTGSQSIGQRSRNPANTLRAGHDPLPRSWQCVPIR